MRLPAIPTVRFASLFVAGSLGLLLVAAAADLFVPQGAYALSNTAPDPADFGRTSVDFTLSNTRDVAYSSNMALTVYHGGKARPGNLTLRVSYQGGAKTRLNQNSQGYGEVRFDGGGAANPGSFVVPISAWRLDSSGRGYEATFSAALVNGSRSGDDSNHINFSLKAASGYIIGSNGGSRFAVVQSRGYCWNGSNCAKYFGYQLPFAPDCSVSRSGQAAISIYDMDDKEAVEQPKHLKVQVKDITTNSIVNNDRWSGSEGNSGTATFNFTYRPQHKYKLLLLDVNANNILQITLPFDSVNYALTCSSNPGNGGGGGGPQTCSTLDTTPGDDISISKSFRVTAAGSYPDAAAARTVHAGGGRAYYILKNSAGRVVASGFGGSVSGATISGSWSVRGQPGGAYTLVGGVRGGSGDETCSRQLTIASHPYFSVVGGDIAAGAGFNSSTADCRQDGRANIESWNDDNSTASPDYNGAGTKLAAFALGNIKSFVSGQGSLYAPHGLSFANSPAPGAPYYGGNFGSLPCLPDYADKITTATPWPGNYGTAGSYIATGTVILPAGQLQPDTVINLKVKGSIYISGNITYNDNGGPGHYPRLNLIATGDIYVAAGVTELHGLYVAQGTTGGGNFVTCAARAGGQPAELTDFNNCGHRQLTVYGAVAARALHLDRSFGDSGLNTGPAEDFVYSPEFWLSAPGSGTVTGTAAAGWDAVSSLPPTL